MRTKYRPSSFNRSSIRQRSTPAPRRSRPRKSFSRRKSLATMITHRREAFVLLFEAVGVERAVFPIPVGDDIAACCDMARVVMVERAAVVNDQGAITVL